VSDLLALCLVGVAAAAAIVVVARPLLRPEGERTNELTDVQRQRLALREERDAALAALRDLEFDHRTGKITDEDYRPLVRDYRRRVADALQALDPDAPAVTPEAAAAATAQSDTEPPADAGAQARATESS
jgi:hypothetical protein